MKDSHSKEGREGLNPNLLLSRIKRISVFTEGVEGEGEELQRMGRGGEEPAQLKKSGTRGSILWI